MNKPVCCKYEVTLRVDGLFFAEEQTKPRRPLENRFGHAVEGLRLWEPSSGRSEVYRSHNRLFSIDQKPSRRYPPSPGRGVGGRI